MDNDDRDHGIDRRGFLRAGLAAGTLGWLPQVLDPAPVPAEQLRLNVMAPDEIFNAPPVQWALRELEQAVSTRGLKVSRTLDGRPAKSEPPESLTIRPIGDILQVHGADVRGVMYGLLDLVDRVRSGEPVSRPRQMGVLSERPANQVRSVMRQFTSEVLDKPWFTDREMWPRYLSMLATHRFNRLHLAFGLGYDTLQQVTDSYLLFLYPFLLDVPGYRVRATNLSDAERDRNLELLRFISEQTVAHGLDFQLGVWMHGYELINSPSARYIIDGLTHDTHAAYCRDALTAVLKACPAISSVALRIHGESGIAEGSYDFWQTVFEGVPRCGRRVEIDLHAKGVDQTMIERALATGMPVNVSPKYWAEHLGMPYHQTAIRDLEMPVAGQTGKGLMTLSEGARSFTRYGYADLLRTDRRYTVRHRIFAGTQRLLLSGDPASTAAYGRMFSFCNSTGFDVMEPLTCRGRRGTGRTGTTRSGYIDDQLETRWDWEKYGYWYRVWGRLTYHPDADATQWQRQFFEHPHADALIGSLARASRILPIVTTAHMPSAACDAYWPEVYWNQPLTEEPRPNPYGDTPAPKTFQHVSPLDPQIFSSMDEHAGELLAGERSGKYSPVEVAQWLEDLAAGVDRDLAPIDRLDDVPPVSRRVRIDASIQAGLGRFFAAKFRAGVLYALFERTHDRRAIEAALASYRTARDAWAAVVTRAEGIYSDDLSASDKISERGQWRDRTAAIDADIDRMAKQLASAAINSGGSSGGSSGVSSAVSSGSSSRGSSAGGSAGTNGASSAARIATAISAAQAIATGTPRRPSPPCSHRAMALPRNVDVTLDLEVDPRRPMTAVWCCYRHVNQAERFERVEMRRRQDGPYQATIPAAYTNAPYPLQYYFVLHERPDTVHLFPGLGSELMRQPYFVTGS
jgi:hypothetical protein